ncbi:MAG TPA: RNA polymerase sigma factor [Candidatus Deferrimicrobiaceae bacterium]
MTVSRLQHGPIPAGGARGKRAPAAVQTLFDRYHETVYGLAVSLLKNRRDAEEVAQHVFLTVARKANRHDGSPALFTWVCRICVNACRIRLRRSRRRETVPIEEFLPAFTREGAHARPIDDWSRDVDHRLPGNEIGQVIGGFAEELPEKYRVVFALCDVQRFSYEETARILALTTATVKARLHRSRLYLRERLGRYLQAPRPVNRKPPGAPDPMTRYGPTALPQETPQPGRTDAKPMVTREIGGSG